MESTAEVGVSANGGVLPAGSSKETWRAEVAKAVHSVEVMVYQYDIYFGYGC